MKNDFEKLLRVGFELHDIFESILKNLKEISGIGVDDYAFKQILLHYCIIIRKDLLSILILYKNNQSFTPNMILRNMVEHFINIEYLEADKKERVEKYVSSSIKGRKGVAKWLIDKKYVTLDNERKEQLDIIEKEFEEKKDIINDWVTNIEQRADNSKAKTMYIPYRLFSLFSHADPNNMHFFIDDSNQKIRITDSTNIYNFTNLNFGVTMAKDFLLKLIEEFDIKLEKDKSELLNYIDEFTTFIGDKYKDEIKTPHNHHLAN